MPNCPNGRLVDVKHLGVLLRVHDRDAWLSHIFNDLHRVARGIRCTISIGVDRPSPKVLDALADQLLRQERWQSRKVFVHELPPIVTPRGAHWMESLVYLHRKHLEDCERNGGPPDAGMLWDDDSMLELRGIRELRSHLHPLLHDRLDVEHKFCWDHYDQYNAAVPRHISTCVWRHYENDTFPTNYVVKCPQRVAKSDSVLQLQVPVRELGWLTPEDRERAFLTAKRAGRLDAHTLSLVRPPVLKRFTE